MSSILEALKKLEADKNLPADSRPVAVADADFGGNEFAYDSAPPSSRAGSVAPLLWVLGGGIFTLLVIGVAVLVIMLLLERTQSPQTMSATTGPAPVSTPVAAISMPDPSDGAVTEAETPGAEQEATSAVASVSTNEAPLQVTRVDVPELPKVSPAPKPVRKERAEERPPSLPVATGAVTPAPKRATSESDNLSPNPEPLPKDIRSLPMLSRNERSQYRLDGVQLNMLNAAGPTRPLGNAFINLEKVFVGEVLPGTNARLVEVTSHGIAIEIQSTRQRYYIPR